MADIFELYKKPLFYGLYRAYFNTSRSQSGEYTPKTQYSREPLHSNSGERERKETQQNEIQPVKIAETKPEIKNENEQSQKIEGKNETIEQNEISTNEKIGLPEYQEKTEQTDITKKSRPANYDKSEIGW